MSGKKPSKNSDAMAAIEPWTVGVYYGRMMWGVSDPIAELRKELALIELSTKEGKLTNVQAEYGAILKIKRALSEIDPTLQGDLLLRRLDQVIVKLEDKQDRALRCDKKGGRPPVRRKVAKIRCVAVGALEWPIKGGSTPRDAENIVLRELNRQKLFVEQNKGKATRSDLENWRHTWLPAQPPKDDPYRRNSAVPAYQEIVRITKQALSARDDAPPEAVSVVIYYLCEIYLIRGN